MKLIVGLGNPGEAYLYTRHNSGFLFVDFLVSKLQADAFTIDKKCIAHVTKTTDLIVAKPQTFMNSSGQAVNKLLHYYKLNPASDLWVVHDDLDIAFGQFKIQKGKGPRIHNGVNSIVSSVHTEQFWHIRIGVAGETYPLVKQQGEPVAEGYLLKNFTSTEQAGLPVIFTAIYSEFTKML